MKISQSNTQADSKYIREQLIAYNRGKLPKELLTDKETINFNVYNDMNKMVAGLTSTMFWGRVHVDFLWVDEKVRHQGYGSELLQKIEAYARDKNCTMIHLDTFSFQAPNFYLKNGYEIFGKIEDSPKGYDQYFLSKKLK
ncbi:acetyltransferase Atu2258 [Paraliobacillus ryukyuensis]|uniref:Acetyltransferase (GNAT) family protein n=1 Tax=Paraliobacillus ryukyuensis TaxID=200904 RepID=A0A366DVH1_9BACI|nr:GNAT family N-acetyltransferase [Paraliobacillus ryukyuensis]RBO93509.1 acetyltransferase (GNAT) family protein [Paraliobacillus ryukyuensis]